VRLRRGWILLALAGLLGGGPVVLAAIRQARQQSAAMSLVRRAATAHKRVSYSGRLSWRRGRWNRSVRVAHDARSGRTLYGWSARWTYVASRPSTKAPDPVAWCRSLHALEANYRAEQGATSRYLDRTVCLLRLESRWQGRPSVELAVDVETGLPLKVTTLRPDGSMARAVAFREIEFGPQEVPARTPRHDGARSIPREQVRNELAFEPLLPAYLPAGFELYECRVSGVQVRKLTFVYTDGVSKLELTQGLIATPAQMETEYTLRYGARRAARRMQWYHEACKRRIVQSDGATGGKVVAKRHCRGLHQTYELTVGRRAVELRCPADMSAEEPARLLRSLRVP